MKNTPEWLALQQAYVVCRVHEDALRDAIDDIKQRKLVLLIWILWVRKIVVCLTSLLIAIPACKMIWAPG